MTTPAHRVRAECERRGPADVVSGCVDLLSRRTADDDLVRVLGGPAAEQVLAGREGGRDGYWPRVWAARGLLYVWDQTALAAVDAATTDDAWRVREMAAKVIARHRLGDALDAVVRLRDDPVPRVSRAAERAVQRLTAARA